MYVDVLLYALAAVLVIVGLIGSVLPALGSAIDDYEGTKGTLRFPVDTPLPRAVVQQLIATRMTQLGLE